MLRKASIILGLFSVLAVSLSSADELVYQGGVGGSAIWFDDNAKPSDVEASINGSISAQSHISAVGMAAFGFDHSYVRGSAGLRFTVTDAKNKNFSIGVGIQRHMSSEPDLRPEEWAPDVSMGWRPWPTSPRVSLNAISIYGLDSNLATVAVGVRFKFTGEYVEESEVTP